YGADVSKKMRQGALCAALSAKLADEQLMIVDDFKLDQISTKNAASALESLGALPKATVILAEPNDTVQMSLRNLPRVRYRVAPSVSALDIVDGGNIVITQAA